MGELDPQARRPPRRAARLRALRSARRCRRRDPRSPCEGRRAVGGNVPGEVTRRVWSWPVRLPSRTTRLRRIPSSSAPVIGRDPLVCGPNRAPRFVPRCRAPRPACSPRRRPPGPSGRGRGSRAAARRRAAEGVLELVAVAPGLLRRLDRLQLEAVEAADPPQGVVDLIPLVGELALVGETLPRGPRAGPALVDAAVRDAIGARARATRPPAPRRRRASAWSPRRGPGPRGGRRRRRRRSRSTAPAPCPRRPGSRSPARAARRAAAWRRALADRRRSSALSASGTSLSCQPVAFDLDDVLGRGGGVPRPARPRPTTSTSPGRRPTYDVEAVYARRPLSVQPRGDRRAASGTRGRERRAAAPHRAPARVRRRRLPGAGLRGRGGRRRRPRGRARDQRRRRRDPLPDGDGRAGERARRRPTAGDRGGPHGAARGGDQPASPGGARAVAPARRRARLAELRGRPRRAQRGRP